MFPFLLALVISQGDDPIIVGKDVDVTESTLFSIPLDLPQSLRNQLAVIHLHVSRDQGKTWSMYDSLGPSEKEFSYGTTKQGMVWFTIQYVYKNGTIEPKDVERFLPLKKVYVNVAKLNVLTKDKSTDGVVAKMDYFQARNVSREDLSDSLQSEIARLEKDYGIQLVFHRSVFPIDCANGWTARGDVVPASSLETYLPLFIEEWRHYPAGAIQKAKIKRIIVCTNLKLSHPAPNGQECLVFGDGWVGGLADSRNEALCYNAFPYLVDNEQTSLYLRDAIHHELFHFLDFRIGGDIHDDPLWRELNPTGFRYGKLNYWDRVSKNVTNRYPGFITRYAQSAIPEDRAETYCHMLMNLHEMECRAKDDEILAKKMVRIKKDLEGFSPEFNEAFWNKIRYLDRPRLTLKGKEDPWADAHPTLPPLPKQVEITEIEKPEWTITPVNCKRRFILHRRGCRS